MTTINPNRFIHGLSDIGKIVDPQQEPTVLTIKAPCNEPIIMPNPYNSLKADELKDK